MATVQFGCVYALTAGRDSLGQHVQRLGAINAVRSNAFVTTSFLIARKQTAHAPEPSMTVAYPVLETTAVPKVCWPLEAANEGNTANTEQGQGRRGKTQESQGHPCDATLRD